MVKQDQQAGSPTNITYTQRPIMFLMFGLGYGFALEAAGFGFRSLNLPSPGAWLSQSTAKREIPIQRIRIFNFTFGNPQCPVAITG